MINFFSETDFELGKKVQAVRVWLNEIANRQSYNIGELSYIFCDDSYLLRINQEYLNHDEFTDIITFDYTSRNILGGDIFISIERVQDNARINNVSFEHELARVMAHGLLHLIGFQDKTDSQSQEMRAQEDGALSMPSYPF